MERELISYKIEGSFSKGLKAIKDDKLIIYSTKKGSWFSGSLISIFNKENNKLIEVRETGFIGSKFKILFQNEKLLNHTLIIIKKSISLSVKLQIDTDNIILKSNPIPLFTKIYARVLKKDGEIGRLLINHASLKKDFSLLLDSNYQKIDIYILILILINETGYDPDY